MEAYHHIEMFSALFVRTEYLPFVGVVFI